MRWIGLKAHVAPVLAVLLCLMVVVPHGVSAQTETSRDLVGGQTVSWNSPWVLSEELTTSGDGFDLLALETQLGLVGVGSYGYPIAGSDVRDIAIEAFAGEVDLRQIDRGDYDNVSYSLDIAESDGFAFGLFALVVESSDGTMLSIMMAPLDAFQSEMESAQAAVTIDGSSIFDGVDASVMQGFLDDATLPDGGTLPVFPMATAGSVQPTSTAVSATEPPATEADSGGGLVGGINSGLQGDEPTPTITAAVPTQTSNDTAAPAPDLPNSYTIPSNGVTVSWSDDWQVSSQDQESIQLESPVFIAFLTVLDLGQIQNSADVQALATSITQQPGFENSTVVVAKDIEGQERDIIVLSEPASSGTIYLIYDVRFGETGASATLLSVFQDDLVTVIDAVPGSLQVDGQPAYADIKELVPEIFPASGA